MEITPIDSNSPSKIVCEVKKRDDMKGQKKIATKSPAKPRRSTFSKYRGIGNPGIGPGRKGVAKWLREVRGQ
jgi:hypothetical protein